MSIYSLYKPLVRPFLFSLDPEKAHSLTISYAKFMQSCPLFKADNHKFLHKECECMGLKFANPLGLAAGLDKNGEAIDFFGSLGFSHLELGTVTPKAQSGNLKPRMFRVVSANGLINRMGFNNKGVDFLVSNLIRRKYSGIVGVSIGKNETTAIENAVDDYLVCMQKVYEHCDYIAINISCPNTKDLTSLQETSKLDALLSRLKQEQGKLATTYRKYVPLVVKIAPDLDDNALESICDRVLANHVDGMSCTNTTTSRDVIYGMEHASEWGGLSGEPIRVMSSNILAKVHNYTKGQIPLIGIGGVNSVMSAKEKLDKGATLIQLYSGLVYEGPELVSKIINHI